MPLFLSSEPLQASTEVRTQYIARPLTELMKLFKAEPIFSVRAIRRPYLQFILRTHKLARLGLIRMMFGSLSKNAQLSSTFPGTLLFLEASNLAQMFFGGYHGLKTWLASHADPEQGKMIGRLNLRSAATTLVRSLQLYSPNESARRTSDPGIARTLLVKPIDPREWAHPRCETIPAGSANPKG